MHKKVLLLCFFSAVILFIYSRSAPPSVYHGDSGETITASYTLGIQHPPGYPLFSLLGKLASKLPAGDISYRIYLLSSFLSIACFLAVFFLIKESARAAGFDKQNEFISALFAAFFSLGTIIWEQSTTAKGGIYMLNILFSASIILLALKCFNSGGKKRMYFMLASFLYGLSMGNHHMTQLVLFPLYAVLFFIAAEKNFFSKKNIFLSLFFFLTGFSIYLYLPLRAISGAVINWGDPSNIENFLQVFSRYQYIRAEGARSAAAAFNQSLYYLSCVFKENVFLLPFMIIGAFLLFKKNKKALFLALLPFFIFLFVTALYLNLKEERFYIMQTYITPVFIASSLLASFSGYAFGGKIARGITILLLSFFLIINASAKWKNNDKSSYYLARDYINNMLILADANSIIFTTGDGIVFPSWYARYVKKIRPDVTFIGSPVLPMKWVRDQITLQNPGIMVPRITEKKIGTESTGLIINAIIKMNLSRYPIYFSYNKPEDNALNGGLTLMPKGLLFRVLPEQFAIPHEAYIKTQEIAWKIMNFRGVFNDTSINDVKLYVKDYAISANAAGVFFEDKGRNDLALLYFTMAHKMTPYDHEFIYNMGNANFNLNNPDEALSLYEKSLRIKPDYESALYNAGVVHYKKSRYKDALYYFKKIKDINPSRTDLDPIINTLTRFPDTPQK